MLRRTKLCLLATLLATITPASALTQEVRSMCEQAEQMINMRQIPQAIQLLNRAASMEPTCGEVHGYLGLAYQNTGNTAQAIEEYKRALQLNPQLTFMNMNIGNCYLNLNQPDAAAPYLDQYLRDNPNSPQAAQIKANIARARNYRGQTDLRAVVDPGMAALNQKRYADAKRSFEQAVAMKPDWAPGHFYLGYTLGSMGQHQQAITEFQTALQLDPTTKNVSLNIGSNYQSLGDKQSAIDWYERFLREDPGSPQADNIRKRIDGLRQELAKHPQAPRAATQTTAAAPPQFAPGGGSQFAPPAAAAPPAPAGTPADFAGFSSDGADYFADITENGRYCRWPAERMPIRVLLYDSRAIPGYRDSYRVAFLDSLAAWQKASGDRVIFAFVNDPNYADLLVDWAADPSKVQGANTAAEAGIARVSMSELPNSRDLAIQRANVTLLTMDQNNQPQSDDEMKKLCLHEIGHAIGLRGHSNNNHDVMFFSSSPSVWPALSKRDKATVLKLYSAYPPRPPVGR